METETTLWTSPYHDEKYGEERTASFKYFKQFIKMPSPRTIVSFHKQLSKQMSKDGRKRIPSLNTLNEYSCKWHWMERSKAYDEYMQHLHDEEMAEKIKKIREKAIGMVDDRLALHQKLTEELEANQEMETNQKIYGFAKNSEGFKNDVASLNELVNEGATNVNMDLDADVKADVESENKTTATIYDIVDSQLEIEEDATGKEGYSDNEEG